MASSWVPENKPQKRGDIALYTRHIEGQPIKAFRGVMQVPNTALDTIALLMDIENYPEWVYQCNTAQTRVIEGQPRLVYMAFNGIWPAKGRDVLVDHRIQQTQNNGTVHIHAFNSLEPYEADQKYLRLPQLNNNWYITPLEDGWVEIEFQSQFRAGGKLPNWLLNLVVTMAPRKTLEGMQRLLASGRYRTSSVNELPIQSPDVLKLRFNDLPNASLN